MSRSRSEAMLVTSWVMTVSTFQLFVVVVLAATLIDDLGLTRWQIGALGAVNTGVGAVLAPRLGRIADRIGARWAIVAVVIVSALGLALTAAAVDYWMLVVASAVAGIPQGSGNSVTNKVIAEEVPPSAQGSVTGVKQSGVQVAVFLSGALLPTSAATIGWRWALVAFAGFTLVTGALIGLRRTAPPPTERSPRAPTAGREPLAGYVYRVAFYALLLGMTAGGVTRFYPLFAQEVLGFTEVTAGLAVSLTGLAAIAARLVWGGLADRAISSPSALRVQAVGGAVTVVLLLAAQGVAAWLLWPAVAVAAFTIMAWNVVAMLTVIRSVPVGQSGRATGVVILGFLGGLTISAPLVGLAIDRLGSYRPVWIALGALSLAGAAVISSPVSAGDQAATGASVPTSQAKAPNHRTPM
ncbi:MAG: MFS transporter [Acidimicrobiia bacterium]|nr:MFS transporter [Acidimicrobiia bacterium]